MKGQASLEFLVVLAVFLAVLVFWIGGVSEAQENIGTALGMQQARLATKKLAAGINSVCVMGKGNSVLVEAFVPGNATVEPGLSLRWGNYSFNQTAYCEFDGFVFTGKQLFNITNEEKVTVRIA